MSPVLRKILTAIGLVLLALLLIYAFLTRGQTARLPVEAVTGAQPKIIDPKIETIPNVNIADPIGWAEGAKPVPAPGLAVAEYAGGLDHPRWMHLLPNGDVLVAETNKPPSKGGGLTKKIMDFLMGRAGAGVPSANRITLLRDADGDGVAEQRSVFLEGLNSPFGMALVGDTLYVANTDALMAFPYALGETRITAPGVKVIDLPATLPNNHWTRNVVANAAGDRLYVAVGSNSNIGENGMESEANRAAILEVDPATKRFRVFASGLRNPVGLAYEPQTGALWTAVNERDMLGGDLAPDYMTRVDFGAFYGWPYSYWGGYVDRRVEPDRPDLLEYTKRPDYALGAHTASLGLAFADNGALGPAFSRGAFVGQHGSWNRTPPSGYKVIFVPFGESGYPSGKPVDVLTGFLNKDGDAQGRPVGVIQDATGALLVADDVGNRIWRVSRAR
jgi:glucose/arabinose dehydrogenase